LILHFEAAQARLDREHNANAWLAWHVAKLPYAKDVKLQDLLRGGLPKTKTQTREQQQNAIENIFLAFGGSADQLKSVREKHEVE